MINKVEKLVVTYFTSAEAMATEKACKAAGIDGSLISAPRELTSDCGISFALSVSDKDKIEKLLNEKKIEFDKIVVIKI